MTKRNLAILLALLVAPVAHAQEYPEPAPQLEKLASLVGNWKGAGSANFGPDAPAVDWTGKGTYRWVLGGHWVQEDFTITFAGVPMPLVMRSYFGWDRDRGSYVHVQLGNDGRLSRRELALLPNNGGFAEFADASQDGVPYVERTRLRVEAGKLHHQIVMLMHEGDAMTVTESVFDKSDQAYELAMSSAAWMTTAAAPAMQKLVRCAGSYAVTGEVAAAPGSGLSPLTMEEHWQSAFGGVALFGRTSMKVAKTTRAFEGHVLWGHGNDGKSLAGVYLSDLGQIMSFEGHWMSDQRFLSCGAGWQNGMPRLERMTMDFTSAGICQKSVSHTMLGDYAPFVSFKASYSLQ